MSPSYRISLKSTVVFALAMTWPSAINAQKSFAPVVVRVASKEDLRKDALQSRLCKEKELDCGYVTALFRDPRLEIYTPPPPAAEQPKPSGGAKEHERNPYLTKRFGLLSEESLERCRTFIGAHETALELAFEKYRVPKEIICGHLRIETDFGIPTKLSPNPFGKRPAINQLVSLYVRNPTGRDQGKKFARRQEFAFTELSKLIAAAKTNAWDLFAIPGSPTGAIGLVQFEPSSFSLGVAAKGNGRIDLFDPDDAVLSLAHYLMTRGFDSNPEHQKRAVYAYYGGHYDRDPRKYYMKAVLTYANEIRNYLKEHPVGNANM
ncbi:MAG TPA: lytic murein transglycosylase [Candidatus Acidoferrales bacterium]|nr:lytic murein transglycosylase [Candidatus Acidoferrales bacterium]